MLELLKAILIGIVQGITEWLPISSTGHMILLDSLLELDVSDAFMEMFRVVIQIGSILAVVVLYFARLNPFAPSKQPDERRKTWRLWGLVVLGVIPSGVIGLLFDDFFDAHFYNVPTVACALILYGIAFILLERRHRTPTVTSTDALTPRRAIGVGCFQVLALIPGTSRSGSTILGASLLGLDRTTAAEFSFFLAIPTMLGAGGLKLAKFGLELLSGEVSCSGREWGLLVLAMAVSFVVSLAAIRFLLDFVKRHTFTAFGIYRIALGLLVLLAGALG
ncbi:MAG: undecaprenyl-diphosphate phosphatase, partial [Clostridia bacterium]|nr:undecaprenyl-diphosphate phosphatase [Clostridia bacterium]